MKSKKTKSGRHIREGYREPSTIDDKITFNECLVIARQNKKKALKYYNEGTVPLNEVIKYSTHLNGLWSKTLKELRTKSEGKWELESEIVVKNKKGKLQKIKGGKSSRRVPDPFLMTSARQLIATIRKEKNYPDSYSFELHTRKKVFSLLQERGFKGSLSWVEKHFHTITHLS